LSYKNNDNEKVHYKVFSKLLTLTLYSSLVSMPCAKIFLRKTKSFLYCFIDKIKHCTLFHVFEFVLTNQSKMHFWYYAARSQMVSLKQNERNFLGKPSFVSSSSSWGTGSLPHQFAIDTILKRRGCLRLTKTKVIACITS
jgi:hypothetical protein